MEKVMEKDLTLSEQQAKEALDTIVGNDDNDDGVYHNAWFKFRKAVVK